MDVTFRDGTISFDSESLQSMDGTEAIAIKNVGSSELPSEYVTSVGIRPVYEISVGDIHDFGEGTLTIRLNYTLKAGESAENLEIWHFSSGGLLVKESCTYDPVEHCVVFTTDSLSKFAIMHVVPDVDDDGNGNGGDGGNDDA